MATVTISRQLGSGGYEMGQAVAEALGAPYLDREIVQLAAARLDIPTELAEDDDERDRLLLRRLRESLLLYDQEVAGSDGPAPSGPARPAMVTHETFQRTMEEIIREVARSGNAVIAGRGGQLLLRTLPHILHVHICAPLQTRIDRLVSQRGLSAAGAKHVIEVSDRERGEYTRAEYGIDWQSPELYDLIINTGRLTFDTAVSLIVTAARSLAATAPTSPESPYQRLRQDYYTAREAAELLMLHPEVIRHAVYAGELPAARAGKDMFTIQRRDLLAWVDRQRQTSRQ